MDDLLSKLLSFPPHPPPQTPLSDHQYDEGIKAQIHTLKGITDNKLLQQTSGGETALDVINPALNTVPYTYILLAHITALSKGGKGVNSSTLWQKVTIFLGTFDPRQIRYLGSELSNIIDAVAFNARRQQQPHAAIAPIRDALLRLDPSGAMLTSHHVLLVKLALDSRAYGAAVPVLDKFILYFPGSSNQPKPKCICDMSLPPTSYITVTSGLTLKIKPLDVLEYFIYSGTVYIGLRDWENALQCLENAITYPSKDGVVSKVMVEAYKKWILASVILDGRARPLPKSTSSGAAKQYHILAKPYETLAQLFETATASRLKAEADAGARIWQNDCNTGLVLVVLSVYQQFQIKNLANIYSKISIPEVLSQTTSAETGNKLPSSQVAEGLVQDMIANHSLNASLSTAPNSASVLTFASGGPVLSEAHIQKEVADSTQRIQALTKEIQQTDRILTHEKEYIKYVQKQKKGAKLGLSGDHGISGADMDWNPAEDEDLMGGSY